MLILLCSVNTEHPLKGFQLLRRSHIWDLLVPPQPLSSFASSLCTLCCNLCCNFARPLLLSVRSQSSRYIRDELLTSFLLVVSVFPVFRFSIIVRWPSPRRGGNIQRNSASCLPFFGSSPPVDVELYMAPSAINTMFLREPCLSIS